jgi:hypothetical protein
MPTRRAPGWGISVIEGGEIPLIAGTEVQQLLDRWGECAERIENADVVIRMAERSRDPGTEGASRSRAGPGWFATKAPAPKVRWRLGPNL